MAKLSIVTIAQNNQDLIKECLNSASWADEIIVVDAQSVDKTAQICKEYTDKIFSNPLSGTLSQQWNFAFSKATCEWIFALAVDERITPQLKKSILEAINSNSDFCGYYVPMRNYFLGKWIKNCGWYPNYNIRLFKNGMGRFEEKEHGLLLIEGNADYFLVESCLEHFTVRSIFQYLEKQNRYSDFAAKEYFDQNAKFRKRFVLTRPLKDFKKVYIKQGGFKEGMHGFFLSAFSAFYKFLLYAKYWELLKEKEKDEGGIRR